MRKKGNRNAFYFKNENVPWNKSKQSTATEKNSTNESQSARTILRPSQSLFQAAMDGQTVFTDGPMVLRPTKPCDEDTLTHKNFYEEENIIFDLKSVPNFAAAVLQHRSDICCNPSIQGNVSCRHGMCVELTLSCDNCSYRQDGVKMYNEQKKGHLKQFVLNDRAILPCLKTKCGPQDVTYMLSALNIRPPAQSSLYRSFNKACDLMSDTNEESMSNNQQFVQKVQHLRGSDNTVSIESDSSYNNRLQAGCEAGTMSITPAVECTSSRKLVVALTVANQHCRKPSCNHDTDECQRTYDPNQSIASTERTSLEKNIKNINEKGLLKVQSVVTDASAQVEKSLREISRQSPSPIQHYYCFVHRLRTFQKHVKALKLKSTIIGMNNETFSQKVSTNVRQRVFRELRFVHKHTKSPEQFLLQGRKVLMNVSSCMCGIHTDCKKNSFVCAAQKVGRTNQSKFENLRIAVCDKLKLHEEILRYFNADNLQKLSSLKTTNKVESIHHRCFTYAPKNTLWTRNMNALCHSAVHSDTFNTGKSSLILAEKLGINVKLHCPFTDQMRKLDRKQVNDKNRQLLYKYKWRRYLSRHRKCYRNFIQRSMYLHANASTSADHSYGINVNA